MKFKQRLIVIVVSLLLKLWDIRLGHICLSAGIAAGADIILLPEIPYDIEVIAQDIQKKVQAGQKSILIACAEGALSKEESMLSKKQYKLKIASREGHSVVYEIAQKLSHYIDKEIRVSLALWTCPTWGKSMCL